MTASQRSALLGMLGAIRACSSCPPDIRPRADALEMQMARHPLGSIFDSIFGGRGGL